MALEKTNTTTTAPQSVNADAGATAQLASADKPAFEDNRPEAVVQMKLKTLANQATSISSTNVVQLEDGVEMTSNPLNTAPVMDSVQDDDDGIQWQYNPLYAPDEPQTRGRSNAVHARESTRDDLRKMNADYASRQSDKGKTPEEKANLRFGREGAKGVLTTGGALAGAAIGAVIPGAGTLAGAAIGAGAGALVGAGWEAYQGWRETRKSQEGMSEEQLKNEKSAGTKGALAGGAEAIKGTAAVGGALVGGLVGSAAGPLGAVAGAAVGGMIGAAGGGLVERYRKRKKTRKEQAGMTDEERANQKSPKQKGRRAFGREMLKGALVTGSAIVGGLAGGLVAGPAGAMIGAAGAGTLASAAFERNRRKKEVIKENQQAGIDHSLFDNVQGGSYGLDDVNEGRYGPPRPEASKRPMGPR